MKNHLKLLSVALLIGGATHVSAMDPDFVPSQKRGTISFKALTSAPAPAPAFIPFQSIEEAQNQKFDIDTPIELINLNDALANQPAFMLRTPAEKATFAENWSREQAAKRAALAAAAAVPSQPSS